MVNRGRASAPRRTTSTAGIRWAASGSGANGSGAIAIIIAWAKTEAAISYLDPRRVLRRTLPAKCEPASAQLESRGRVLPKMRGSPCRTTVLSNAVSVLFLAG